MKLYETAHRHNGRVSPVPFSVSRRTCILTRKHPCGTRCCFSCRSNLRMCGEFLNFNLALERHNAVISLSRQTNNRSQKMASGQKPTRSCQSCVEKSVRAKRYREAKFNSNPVPQWPQTLFFSFPFFLSYLPSSCCLFTSTFWGVGGPFQTSVNEISFGSCTERVFAMYEFTGFLK